MPASRLPRRWTTHLSLLVAPALALGLLVLCLHLVAATPVALANNAQQSPSPEGGTDGKTVFTRDDGLADNRVTALLRDDRVLWVGTMAGLSRYTLQGRDAGLAWETFHQDDGMAADAVVDLWRGDNGGLWVAHPGGQISVFDGISWTTYKSVTETLTQAYKQIVDGNIAGPYWSIEEGGRVWTLADDTVGYYVGAVWRPYGQDAGIPSGRLVAVWAGDGAWIATENGQIGYFDGVNWSIFRNAFEAVQSQYDTILASGTTVGPLWVVDQDEAVWVRNAFNQRSPQPDVRRYFEGEWTNFSSRDGMANGFVEELRLDEFGRVWARHSADETGQGGGLSLYLGGQPSEAPGTNSWTSLTPAFTGNVTDFWPEDAGSVWIGSTFQPETGSVAVGGLTFFDLDAWQRLPLTALGGAAVSDTWLDENSDLWLGLTGGAGFGPGGGLWRYRPPQDSRPARWTRVEGVLADDVRDLWGDGQGSLWVATADGVNHITLKNRTVTSYTRPFGTDLLAGDAQGQVWTAALGEEGAVWQWDGSEWTSHTVSSGLSSGTLSDMQVSLSGDVYLAGDRGLDIWDGTAWSNFSALPGRYVEHVWQDDTGDLWVSSEITPGRPFNLSLKQGSKWETVLSEEDSRRMGLAPLALLRDARGVAWLGTPAGLFAYAPDKSTQWRGLGPVEGLPAGPTSALYQDASGTVWIAIGDQVFRTDHLPCTAGASGSSGGEQGESNTKDPLGGCGEWVRFDPGVGAVNRIADGPDGSVVFAGESGVALYRPRTPDLRLERVTNPITGETVDSSQPVIMSIGRNAVKIDLTTIAPALTEHELAYRYRLEGAEEDWRLTPAYSLGGKQASVTYAGLPGGVYTFTAAARTATLDYSPEVSFSLYVLSRSPELALDLATVAGRPSEQPGTLESNIGQPIQIRLTSSDDQPEPLMYRYRIEGLGTGWTETASAEVSFTLSAAGIYTFVALAVDNEGQASEQVGAQINVTDPSEVQASFQLPVESIAAGMGVLAVLLIGSAIVLIVRRKRRESW
jgi:ligand-binding sensor domain-containing protein